jgi:hypothetical protein
VGIIKKKKQTPQASVPDPDATPAPPTLARRSANRHSTMRSGRTIGEQREHLETANERMAARQKDKRRQHARVFFVSIGFILLAVEIVVVYFEFFHEKDQSHSDTAVENITYKPTVEVIDEDAAAGSGITSRMSEYIGQAEADYRSLDYHPVKVVVPTGSIREVDFYLDGYPGYIKMHIDRPTAVSVEDADRMLRYLAGQGIAEFQYIDVRIPYKGYWK